MADLAITAANVIADDGYGFTDGIAGETITQGQTVYLKSSDTRFWKADNNNGADPAVVSGIALNAASAGQPIRVMQTGTITIGATVAIGETYVQSRTAGGIAPIGDLLATDYVTFIGIGTTAAKIALGIKVSGVQKA